MEIIEKTLLACFAKPRMVSSQLNVILDLFHSLLPSPFLLTRYEESMRQKFKYRRR